MMNNSTGINTIKLVTIGLALVMLTLVNTRYASAQFPVVTIGLHHFPPYTIRGENGNLSGLIVDIVHEVFSQANIEVEFKYLPYSRSIALAEQSKIHAVGMLNSETSNQLNISASHTCSLIQSFYTRKGNTWRYTGIESLDSQNIVTVSDYNYETLSPEYQKYLESMQNVYHMAAGENYVSSIAKMIIAGRVDVFNEDRASMIYALAESGLTDELIEVGTFPAKLDQYVGFSNTPEADEFRKIFDRSFAKLLNSGQITKILKRYSAFRS